MTTVLFDVIPRWLLFFGTGVIVFLSIMIGFILGVWHLAKKNLSIVGPVSSIAAAMLGLLALVLAFTFGTAASRFDVRKQLLLNETHAIETAFLRADLIADPYRTECRKLLKTYIDLRASVGSQRSNVVNIIAESEKIHKKLWQNATHLARTDPKEEINALFIDSLNEVIELHTLRVTTGLQYRIPMGVWYVLFLLTIFTMMAVGYQFGLAGANSFIVYIFMAFGFSLIITIIADLDSATRGNLKVNQQPMIELQKRINSTTD